MNEYIHRVILRRRSPEPHDSSGMRLGAVAAMATASFVFVTAEILPVGLLPQIAEGLSVTEASVGLLLTTYAAVAAATTIPLTAIAMRIPRHHLLVILVVVFAVSQAAAAVAPTFPVLIVTRLLCALAHGVFWSTLAPAASRLAPPGQAGRVTSLVFVGNSAALVIGLPLGTALGQWAGWRVAFGTLAVAGALSAVALRTLLPAMAAEPGDRTATVAARLRTATDAIRSRAIASVCAVTVVLVIGHFAAYTYLTPLVRSNGGLDGFALSALLLGWGAAGLVGNVLGGRVVDRRPGAVMAGSLTMITSALILLALAPGPVATVVAVLVWALGFSAVPVTLQTVVLRVAPQTKDAASALYVVAFQIGIGGGALIGERFVAAGLLGALPVVGAIVAAAAAGVMLRSGDAFPLRTATAIDLRPEPTHAR